MQRARKVILLTAMATMLCSAAALAYPPAGYDVVNTSANVSIYDPLDPATLLEVVAMDGRAVIYRGDPYDAGGGVMTIDTRMDTLILRGYSLNFGDSVFAVLDRSGPQSTGQIWQLTAGTDFPAESLFDVYYKLTFTTEPANPSPGNGSDDNATRHGSFDYDLKSQSGSMVSAKAVPLTSKLPERRPAQETPDKGARQGGEDIGSAVYLPTIPTVTVGTTCGYADDYNEVCPYTNTGAPDVVYVIDPPVDGFLTISTCFPGGYDTKLYVYENTYTPGAPYACNDDACPDYTSIISCMPVLANATYYIVVDGYSATDCGDYELSIDYADNCVPCVLDCDAASYQEAEPCGNDDNGGCNSVPPQFEQIGCGMDVCGTAWADGGTRDTDWYSFTLASTMTVELTGSAEFPYILGFLDTADCGLGALDPVAVGLACDTQSVSRVAGPGTYWVFVAVNDYNNYPCGTDNDYFFQLRCYSSGGDLTPVDPPHMIDTIWQVPPVGRVYIDPRKTPVVNAAGDTIAWVWHEHIVDPPDSGQDTVPTIGIMSYWQGPNPPGGTQPPDETVELVGQAIISRGQPYIGELGLEVQTEILSMDLTGESAELGPMILSLPFPAPGHVMGVDPEPFSQLFPAESFFDVYYQVDLPAMGLTIEPIQPPRMQTTVQALPPVDNQYTPADGQPHPVHDIQNPGVPIGWILPIHWVQPPPIPPIPPDTIPTIGIMPVIIGPTQPAPDQKPDEVIHLSGDVILQRGAEYDDPPSGQHVIEVEILQMELTGTSDLFGATILSLPQPAAGQITTAIGDPQFPAESYFDVYYEVELPDQGQTIAPEGDPPHMHTQINELPPINAQYGADDWHPVHDVQNPGVIIGWVWPIHWVDPPDPPPPDPVPTIGLMPVIVGPTPPVEGQSPDETIVLAGDAVIQRGPPYTNNQGQTEIQTEILSMDLTGNSSLFGPVILSLPQPAPGLITSLSPTSDFPAESFFNVYYEVELPDQGQTVAPSGESPHMHAEITEIPPDNTQLVADDWHAVNDVANPGVIIGWVRPIHWVNPPPTGACCDLTTGACTITTQASCDPPGSNWEGAGSECSPNPCEQPCTGWLPGTSTILYTSFQLDIYDPNNSSVFLGTAYAFGAGMVVQRNAPYEVSPGIWRMDIDILAFTGVGNSSLLGGGFVVGLDPNEVSTGYIQMCDSCDDFLAESHFDIKWRVSTTLPFPNAYYYGNALMDLNCDQQWNPYSGGTGDFDPPNGHTYVDPRKVPIYNENGEIIGYSMKRHRVDKEPLGACCEDGTGLCFIMTQVECQESGGMYMGDDVSCDPNPCPQPGGACCEQGTGLCFVMTQADCEAAQGTYMGDGSTCDPNPCETGCCMGPMRGNIDNDALDQIDISDLVYLVDYMFNGGPEPPCWDEAELSAPFGDQALSISDLVYLVDYMFTGGPPPPPCDLRSGPAKRGDTRIGEEIRRQWSALGEPMITN